LNFKIKIFGWVDHPHKEQILFPYKLTTQNLDKILLCKHFKEKAFVVTNFLPHKKSRKKI
jgi:hypothetical protein